MRANNLFRYALIFFGLFGSSIAYGANSYCYLLSGHCQPGAYPGPTPEQGCLNRSVLTVGDSTYWSGGLCYWRSGGGGHSISLNPDAFQPLTCTAPQYLNSSTNTCVTPPTCTDPQYFNTVTLTCVTPPICTLPQVLDNVTHTCVTPPLVTCTVPQVLDTATNSCVTPPPPTCTVPQVLDTATNSCVTPSGCPAADTLHSKGFFNLGTVPTGKLLNTACVSGCTITLRNGVSPAAKSLVNGVYHYYGQAEYRHLSTVCTPDTPSFLSEFVGTLPGATCGTGQQMISMNGVTKCFDSSGNQSPPDAAAAAAAAKAAADAQLAKAIQDAGDAAAAAGGTATDIQNAKNVAAGVGAAGGTGGTGSTQNNPDPVQAQFCKDNPTAPICVEQDFGTVEDATLTDKPISVSINPVSVGGMGSCPAPSPMMLHGQQYFFQWTTYCNYATGIKPVLLAFAWLAAAGILVGGFRS